MGATAGSSSAGMGSMLTVTMSTHVGTLGRALYAAEADRIRNWAESRARFSFTDAMEMYAENTWVSVFSLSVVCAFIILSSSGTAFPGT
ncbi:hypothetical protein BHE74_00005774 [Ensete ventricosum]|uniref:Uncharacterized protein n=1 Tax=Ensete ventricosum TaxID=4639 RepID=A0A444F3E2_ENSVE|nr:hypothetical protein GW17_00018956 [Ensete ventricosum]RWW85531.1 hypothetical protein BHE74_00005774 [Ensete ventricosum]RZR70981.1 hypothetical protein BHM03_00002582 [Ensete ventricosum]